MIESIPFLMDFVRTHRFFMLKYLVTIQKHCTFASQSKTDTSCIIVLDAFE